MLESLPEHMERGTIIAGKYRLRRALEQGGMASVWVAENIALGIEVAIKLPLAEAVPHAVPRMLREAQLSAQIAHPNIVRVFDFGITREREPFIVMELLHGDCLEDVLVHDGRLDPVEAIRLLLPLADALAAAHERGIVHRDLKPANVFLSRDSKDRVTPKLLDFGIAKLDRVAGGNLSHSRRLTRGGTAVGSPDYMSPEQAQGLDDIDHRTDIWSFCVLAYELVNGSVPFADVPNNNNELLRAIIERPVKPFSCSSPGSFALWKILERGLVRREERISSIRELGVELARWLVDQGVDEDIESSSLRTTWLGMPSRTTLRPSQLDRVRAIAAGPRSRRALKRLFVAAALGVAALGLEAKIGFELATAAALENGSQKVVPAVVARLKNRAPATSLPSPRSKGPEVKPERIVLTAMDPIIGEAPKAAPARRPAIDIWSRAKRASRQ